MKSDDIDDLVARINAVNAHRFIGWLVSEAPEIVEAVLDKIAVYDTTHPAET